MAGSVSAYFGLLQAWWFYIDWSATVLALMSIPSVLVRRRGRPLSAMSWILAMVGLPVIGIFCWWLFGRQHLERRKRRTRDARETVKDRLSSFRLQLDSPQSRPSTLLPLRCLPEELAESVFPPTEGNEVRLLANGREAFDAMEADIASAKHHVHALFYIFKADKTGEYFRDLLVERAKEGIEVRVICDAYGSPGFTTQFARPLRKAGAQIARFLPPNLLSFSPRLNFRNHRKLLIIDGRVGVIGGFNIGDDYRHKWRDMGVRIQGPAVDQLQEIFAKDWYYTSHENLADPPYFGAHQAPTNHAAGAHQAPTNHAAGAHQAPTNHAAGTAVAIIGSGPDSHFVPIHDAIFMSINDTRSRLLITTPYFIPSTSIVAAIRAACFRGVDVRVMLPQDSDVGLVRYAARSYYPELLEVGVRIFEYKPSMLHAKVLVSDNKLAMIGSANLDSRSFRLNFEASAFVGGPKLSGELAAQFETDQKECEEVFLDKLEQRAWTSKFIDSAAHLLSPLL